MCWPAGTAPKVVPVHDVPDLREPTAGMGVVLGIEGLVGQRKTNPPPPPPPSCCVTESKCSLSLVMSQWLKENMKIIQPGLKMCVSLAPKSMSH